MTTAEKPMQAGEISARFLESAICSRTSGDANQPYLVYLQQQMKQHGQSIKLRVTTPQTVNQKLTT